jgi:hypothetical protein
MVERLQDPLRKVTMTCFKVRDWEKYVKLTGLRAVIRTSDIQTTNMKYSNKTFDYT